MDLYDHRAAVAAFVFAFQRDQRLLAGNALQPAGAVSRGLRPPEIPDGVPDYFPLGESEQFTLGLIDALDDSVAIHFMAGTGAFWNQLWKCRWLSRSFCSSFW
jgi:hypothetical protein